MTNTTKTILLTESGDLEVYEGKRPEEQEVDKQTLYPRNYHDIKQWLSTKRTVKMAEGEIKKLSEYVYANGMWKSKDSLPIDVSDVVEIRSNCCGRCDGHNDECDSQMLGYFKPPVDKEVESLQDLAELIQNQCHSSVEKIKSNTKNFDYQDAINVFIIRKLAELQLQINEITIKRK